jgi:hypothetical protein
MPTYVVFDRETGEPVLTHAEPEGVKTSQEGLLSMVDPSYDRSRLEVTLVDPDTTSVGYTYGVDLRTRKLEAVERESVAGFGGGSGRLFDPESTIRPVRVVYEPGTSDETKVEE